MSQETLTTQEAQAAWDEVAAERAAGDTPPAPAPVEQAQQPEPAASTEAPAAAPQEEPKSEPVDPLAGLPDVVKEKLAKLDALEAQVVKQQREYGAAIGRVAALQREVEAAKKLAPQMSAGPTQAEIAEAAKSPEKWEAMKADFPDLGEALEELLSYRLSGLKSTAQPEFDPAKIDAIVNARLEQEKQELQRTIEEVRVDVKHPAWRETINTPEFGTWFAAQDAAIKDLAASPKGSDAIRLLDMYAQATAKPVVEVKQERQNKLAAAAVTRPGVTPPPKTEDDMNPVELWNYLAKKRQK